MVFLRRSSKRHLRSERRRSRCRRELDELELIWFETNEIEVSLLLDRLARSVAQRAIAEATDPLKQASPLLLHRLLGSAASHLQTLIQIGRVSQRR